MIASYILSRTLVPTLVMLLMRGTHGDGTPDDAAPAEPAAARLPRLRPPVRARPRAPTRVRCRRCSTKRGVFGVAFLAFCLLSCGLYPFLGRDFFPSVDAGQIRLHLRAPTGTRIEETARLADDVEAAIRQLIPKDQLETILDNLGVPNSGINLSYSNAGTIGTLDGEIQLSLKEGPPADRGVRDACCAPSCRSASPASSSSSSRPTSSPRSSTSACRRRSTSSSPATTWRPTPRSPPSWSSRSSRSRARSTRTCTSASTRPAVNLQMDRTRLQQMGLSAQNVGQNVLVVALGQLADGAGVLAQSAERRRLPDRGADAAVPGRLARRAAQHAGRRHRRRARRRDAGSTQLLGNLVEATSGAPAGGRLALQHPAGDRRLRQRPGHRPGERRRRRCRRWSTRSGRSCRAAARSTMRGQVQTMQASFIGLGVGLAMAIVLVYLLIVVNFQSWIDARRSSSPRCRRRSPASPGCSSSPARRCRCRRSPARS